MYVCICHTVTEADVDRAIAGGAHCEVSVGEATGAGTGCGSCVDRVCDLLQRAVPGHGKMPLKVAV